MFNRLLRYTARHPMYFSSVPFEEALRRWHLVQMLEKSNYYYPQC